MAKWFPRKSRKPHDPDDVRMSFGEHLEELRTRIIRLLLGALIGMVVCFIFGDKLFQLILWPLNIAYRYHDMTPEVITLDPTEIFVVYMKISLYCGLIFTAPYGLYQLWAFVAAGLYSHEQRFVRQFFPISLVLFATGVVFCFAVVLPLVFSFLIGIRSWIPSPMAESNFLIDQLLPKMASTQPVTTGPAADLTQLPMLAEDPPNPQPGDAWFNLRYSQLKLQTAEGVRTVPLTLQKGQSFVRPQLALNYVISFVTRLALGFGIGFQVPIVVVLLAMVGIASVATMASVRRYVLLGMVAISAVVTPPDVTSQVLLSVPMYLLYEGGLLAARIIVRRREQEIAGSEGGG